MLFFDWKPPVGIVYYHIYIYAILSGVSVYLEYIHPVIHNSIQLDHAVDCSSPHDRITKHHYTSRTAPIKLSSSLEDHTQTQTQRTLGTKLGDDADGACDMHARMPCTTSPAHACLEDCSGCTQADDAAWQPKATGPHRVYPCSSARASLEKAQKILTRLPAGLCLDPSRIAYGASTHINRLC